MSKCHIDRDCPELLLDRILSIYSIKMYILLSVGFCILLAKKESIKSYILIYKKPHPTTAHGFYICTTIMNAKQDLKSPASNTLYTPIYEDSEAKLLWCVCVTEVMSHKQDISYRIRKACTSKYTLYIFTFITKSLNGVWRLRNKPFVLIR